MTSRTAAGRAGADTTYLLHFDQPIGNTDSKTGYAQHYTGSTPDLPARLAKHLRDSDVKIMAAVRQAGIGWVLARTWPGGRVRERQLKRQGGARRHCPVCKGAEPLALPSLEPAAPARAPRRPAARQPVPELLEDSVVCRLDPAESAGWLAELAAAERAARAAAGTAYSPAEREARRGVARDLSALRAAELAAVRGLAEARALAVAEGWLPRPGHLGELEPPPLDLDLDLEAG